MVSLETSAVIMECKDGMFGPIGRNVILTI